MAARLRGDASGLKILTQEGRQPMRRRLWVLSVALVGASWMLASTDSGDTKKCCFTHPDYSGTCEVVPAEGETCESILKYLNTPMSQGKTYCSGTQIRGGWKLEPCSAP
jgi:hypothetical protein